MTDLIKANNLKKHYPVRQGMFGGTQTLKALDGVSFTLKKGQTLAVVGESGCGKSTLARLITQIERPTEGEFTFHGVNLCEAKKSVLREVREKIQIVFQNPFGSLNPRKKIGKILEEPLYINTKLSAKERHAKAKDMLRKVGLRSTHHGRYPHMFSGGQRQRVAIARALMLQPEVVVADEPVSALDVSIQAQILNLLMDLQDEFGLAYLFISHDLSVVHHIADEIMVMYLGKVVEHGKKEELYKQPLHPYTQVLLASTPHTDPKQRQKRIKISGELPSPLDPPLGCSFHKRCPFATERCKNETPALRDVASHKVACHHAEKILSGEMKRNPEAA